MNRKTLTIAITIASLFMTGLSAVEGWVPPGWGLIVASLVTGIYALVRAGRKVLDGADWKTLWGSTETWAAVVTWAASLVGLVSGVVPAKYVGIASAIAGALLTMSRQLNGQTSPMADRMRVLGKTGAIPVADIKPVVTPLPRIPGPDVVALLVLAGSLLAASTALAQTPPSPQFGGCFAQGQVCLGPSASITLGELNLATSKFSGGIIPGVGYGVTYAQSEWYATGLALYFSFKAGQDGPNQAIPSLVLSFANYVRVGTGVAITETDGPVQTQWLLLFGLGSDFGGSPKYTQAQQQKALAAQREGVK